MSIYGGSGENSVFKSREKQAEFWERFNALLTDFPEILDIPEDRRPCDYHSEEPFDEKDPMFVDGMVVILSLRNLTGHEFVVGLDPESQSMYMTRGLVDTAKEVF